MDSIVSCEPLFPEAIHYADHGLNAQGKLVFDDRVGRRITLTYCERYGPQGPHSVIALYASVRN